MLRMMLFWQIPTLLSLLAPVIGGATSPIDKEAIKDRIEITKKSPQIFERLVIG